MTLNLLFVFFLVVVTEKRAIHYRENVSHDYYILSDHLLVFVATLLLL